MMLKIDCVACLFKEGGSGGGGCSAARQELLVFPNRFLLYNSVYSV